MNEEAQHLERDRFAMRIALDQAQNAWLIGEMTFASGQAFGKVTRMAFP